MTDKQLVYLYCVTNEEPTLTGIGDTADGLYLVKHKGLYAVSARVHEREFDEEGLKRNMADLQWVKTHATLHERVIEQVMSNACVIPFKFGTLFNNDDSLKAMLDEYGAAFREMFSRLGNSEEWGVKIYCEVENGQAACAVDDPELMQIENQIKSSPPGKAFFLEKKRAELLTRSANAKIEEFAQQSFRSLKQLSVEARINKVLPKEVTESLSRAKSRGKADMVLNSAFLVDKQQANNFVGMAETLRLQGENSGFFVHCTGPWPPYNFCGLSRQEVKSA